MTSRLNIILLMAIVIGFSACKKEFADPIDFKYDYFPLDSGSVWLYDAEYIYVNEFNNSIKDTIYYQIKEVVGPSYIDQEGDEAVEIWRYEKIDTAQNWSPKLVWSAKRTTTQAEKTEDNLRFIKLVFAPQVGVEWNGNTYLNVQNDIAFYEDWVYEYLEVDDANTVNGLTYDSTLLVLQVDDENLQRKKYSEEIYARHKGLVYKEEIFLETIDEKITNPWTDPTKWKGGHILKMHLVSYTN